MLLFQTSWRWSAPIDGADMPGGWMQSSRGTRVPREKLGKRRKEGWENRTWWIRHLFSIAIVVFLFLQSRWVWWSRPRPVCGTHCSPGCFSLPSPLCSLGCCLLFIPLALDLDGWVYFALCAGAQHSAGGWGAFFLLFCARVTVQSLKCGVSVHCPRGVSNPFQAPVGL